MPRRPLLSLVLLCATVTTGRSVSAQARDSVARRIEPVTVRSNRTPSVVGGASAIVLRPDSLPMPLMPSPLLDQVLRQSPFVLVRQNSRGEMELSVRGSDSRQAAVLVDGLPITLGWDHRSDPSLFPTTGVDRIQIVRGLGTVLAGPNTLGGVIELHLNDPLVRGAAAPPPTAYFGSGLDQFAGRVLSATASAPIALGGGTFRVRAGATYRERPGFARSGGDAGDGVTGGAADPGDARDSQLRTNTDLRQVDGFGALRYDHGSGAFVGLTLAANDARRGVAPEQHIRAPRFWRYPQQGRQLGILSAGTGVRTTPFGYGTLQASVGANRSDVEIESYSSRTFTTVSTRELGDEETRTARVQASHSLPRGGQLRIGGTTNDVRYDETLDAQLATSVASEYQQRLTSLGAEVEVPVTSRLLVSGGAVRDAARSPKTGGKVSLGTLSKAGWRVGTTFLARPGVRLHLSASERARFPALRELYSGALSRFDPNPLLRPETLLGIEAGVTMTGAVLERHGLQVQAVGFRHRLDDAVVRITLPSRLFRRINRDQIRSAGFEGAVSWSPPSLSGVTVTADGTIQRIRVHDNTITGDADNARRPEHNPEFRGALAIGAPIVAGIRGSVVSRHTGAQYCLHPDLGTTVKLAGQTTGDAALSRGFALRRGGLVQRIVTTLALDNVANRTVYDQCGLPQPGRTFRMGFELR